MNYQSHPLKSRVNGVNACKCRLCWLSFPLKLTCLRKQACHGEDPSVMANQSEERRQRPFFEVDEANCC